MAQRKKKRTGAKKGQSRNVAPPPQRRRDGKAALKGMGVGALIFAVLALVFFVRIGGQTPFNHLANALSGDDEKASTSPSSATPKDGQKTRAKKARPTPVRTIGSKPRPKRRAVTTNAKKAPPLEKTTIKDEKSLDQLIKSKGQ